MFYDRHIFVCDNKRAPDERKSCGLHNSESILKHMKKRSKEMGFQGKLRIQRSGCLDRCELGPVVVSYPEGKWFRISTIEEAEEFLQNYVLHSDLQKVESLVLQDGANE